MKEKEAVLLRQPLLKKIEHFHQGLTKLIETLK